MQRKVNAFSRLKVRWVFFSPTFHHEARVYLVGACFLPDIICCARRSRCSPKPLEVMERKSGLLCWVHLRDLTWILVTLTQFHTSYFIHLVLVRGGHGKWVTRISNQRLTFQECPEADRLFRIMCSVHSGAVCQGLQGPHSGSHRAKRLKQTSQLLWNPFLCPEICGNFSPICPWSWIIWHILFIVLYVDII